MGGSISIQGQGYEGYLGAGALNGVFQLGTYAKTSFGSYQLTAGTRICRSIYLPTFFLVGGSMSPREGSQVTLPGHDHVFVFAGMTTLGMGTPLFQAFKDQTSLGAVFLDKQITETFHFYSRNIISRTQTWIQGFDWQVRPWLKTGLSAGTGSNKPYFAASLDAVRNW